MELTAAEAIDRTLLLIRQQRLPDAGTEEVLACLQRTTVAIVADEENLRAPAAQTAVVTLAGLVLACGMRIRLVMPSVAIAGYQPPLVGSDLVAGIVDLAGDLIPGGEAVADIKTRAADLVFVIGNTPWRGDAGLAWRLAASPWAGYLLPPTELAPRIEGAFPIGAAAAAAMAAAEPFRAALRAAAALTRCTVPIPEFLTASSRAEVILAPGGTRTDGFALGAIDMVSGGAISTAALHLLLRIPGCQTDLRVWEPQTADGSNLNRYPLLRRSMVGMPKVEVLSRWAAGGVTLQGDNRQVTDELVHTIGSFAPRVLVGTDNVESRWTVQETWPEWLCVAGTAGFMVMVSEHEPGRPCVRCLHRATENVPGDIPTVSFVSYWGGLLAIVRLLRQYVDGPCALTEQETEVWADRLDSQYGFQHRPIPRMEDCPTCREGSFLSNKRVAQ
jgi:hypothetical protein